jgi:hypothetical protein
MGTGAFHNYPVAAGAETGQTSEEAGLSDKKRTCPYGRLDSNGWGGYAQK